MKKQSTDNFDKFATKKKGSAVKEAFRQEKKKIKLEARAAGEEMRKKKIEKLRGIDSSDKYPKAQGPGYKPQDTRFKGQNKRNSNKSEVRSQKSGVSEPKTTPDPKLQTPNASSVPMPLNKFIAHAGVCGRREAAELVKEGKVTVNGDKIFEPGYKVTGIDKVTVKGTPVFLQKN